MRFIKSARLRFIGVLTCFMLISLPDTSTAQCAMCSLNAENSTKDGNTQGKGLNTGILFLLSMPFIFGIGIGYLWYKKFRVNQAKEEINTNNIIKE